MPDENADTNPQATSQSTTRSRPTLAVSMGDPVGIGPEVLVRSLADAARRGRAKYHIYGCARTLEQAANLVGVEPFWWTVPADGSLLASAQAHPVVVIDDSADVPTNLQVATETAGGGASSFRWVERAISATQLPKDDPAHAHGIVTAPINKAAWAKAGKSKWAGHTELLANRLGAKRSRMMFIAPQLRTMLVTAHLPLMKIRDVLTFGRVFDTIDLAHEACLMLGVEEPRIAVCGLNPHAGEGGLMGDEEDRVITPAITHAKGLGMDVTGPLPGDTVFGPAVNGSYDIVVAMYHDQGLIPVKLLAFDTAVNATIGLPTVRTSPDHGTAYDIAWKGIANPGSMTAAIDVAVQLASEK